MARIILALMLIIGISGCSNVPLIQSIAGTTGKIIDVDELADYRENQNIYLLHFAHIAREKEIAHYDPAQLDFEKRLISSGKPVDREIFKIEGKSYQGLPPWADLSRAGWAYIDIKCNNFLRELYSRKKSLTGIKKMTSAVAATTASVLGISGSSAKSLALVAAAFGLAQITFDIADETLLTTLDYNSVSQLVRRTQFQYKLVRQNAGIDDRVDAVEAIQGYIYICEPSVIEANVNNQVQSGDALQFFINQGILPAPKNQSELKIWKGLTDGARTGTIYNPLDRDDAGG